MMIPLGSLAPWLYIASLAGIVFIVASVIEVTETVKEWLGDSVLETAGRVVLALVVLVMVRQNQAICSYECAPWLGLTTVILSLMVVAGWRSAALLLSGAYLISNFLWGVVLGINLGPGANMFQLVVFVFCAVVAFLHLRRRITGQESSLLSRMQKGIHQRSQRWQATAGKTPSAQTKTRERTRSASSAAQSGRTTVLSASVAASGLYLTTALIEAVSAMVRSVVYFFASLFVLSPLYIFMLIATRELYHREVQAFLGTTWTYDYRAWLLNNVITSLLISVVVGLVLGWMPLLRSLFHIVFPYTRSGAGEQERDALGAREPTRGEHQKIIDTLVAIHATASVKDVAVPSNWLVIDAPTPDAYTIGSTVYVTRAAIEDSHFAGIVAHELGHLAHSDGDLVLAVRRFVIPLAYFVGIDRQPTPAGSVLARGSNIQLDVIRNEDEKIFYRVKALEIKLWLAFWCGGLGMFFLGQSWARFWRARDFLADDYAVQLGQADSLMGILKTYQHVDVAQPFLLSNRPYTAERLDRLQG